MKTFIKNTFGLAFFGFVLAYGSQALFWICVAIYVIHGLGKQIKDDPPII
jgi:hypothetical protein